MILSPFRDPRRGIFGTLGDGKGISTPLGSISFLYPRPHLISQLSKLHPLHPTPLLHLQSWAGSNMAAMNTGLTSRYFTLLDPLV